MQFVTSINSRYPSSVPLLFKYFSFTNKKLFTMKCKFSRIQVVWVFLLFQMKRIKIPRERFEKNFILDETFSFYHEKYSVRLKRFFLACITFNIICNDFFLFSLVWWKVSRGTILDIMVIRPHITRLYPITCRPITVEMHRTIKLIWIITNMDTTISHHMKRNKRTQNRQNTSPIKHTLPITIIIM